MKISVLMSVYDRDNPTHFRRALESIWTDQTLKPHEIILVEDGPLNLALENEIGDFRIATGANVKIIKLAENKGLTHALNIGIIECGGDLIARMDSDDISAADRFKLQHDYFMQNPTTDVLGGAIQEFGDGDDCRFVRYYPENTQLAKRLIARGSPFAHPSVMFNRRVFDQGFRYNERFQTSQDIDFWFKLLANGFEFANIRTVLLYYRMNEDFYRRRSISKAIGEFRIYWSGILGIFGWNWKLIYPVLRLAFRLTPAMFVRKIYASSLRGFLNAK